MTAQNYCQAKSMCCIVALVCWGKKSRPISERRFCPVWLFRPQKLATCQSQTFVSKSKCLSLHGKTSTGARPSFSINVVNALCFIWARILNIFWFEQLELFIKYCSFTGILWYQRLVYTGKAEEKSQLGYVVKGLNSGVGSVLWWANYHSNDHITCPGKPIFSLKTLNFLTATLTPALCKRACDICSDGYCESRGLLSRYVMVNFLLTGGSITFLAHGHVPGPL